MEKKKIINFCCLLFFLLFNNFLIDFKNFFLANEKQKYEKNFIILILSLVNKIQDLIILNDII